MRVLILTTHSNPFAALCLPALAQDPGIELVLVVNSAGVPPNRWRFIKRKWQKVQQIGLLGMLNGQRISRWYTHDAVQHLQVAPLEEAAARFGIPVERTKITNSDRTRELFRAADADVGLSLGNAYIVPSVFTIPRRGMLNVHHEVLPQFRGAQSVIWQLYEGSTQTGYTIHRIDHHIDTGHNLYQEIMPVELKPALRETVAYNYARLMQSSVQGLLHVLHNFDNLVNSTQPQSGGRTFTTPTWSQYRQIVREHRRLLAAVEQGGDHP